MIQAKSWDALAQFQTMHLLKCFNQWCNYWACCIRSQED